MRDMKWFPVFLLLTGMCLALPVVAQAGTVTTVAGSGVNGYTDGVGAAAQFNQPRGVAVTGGFLYVADQVNHRIRKIDLATGTVTTLAGSGASGYVDSVGVAAQFNQPRDVVADGGFLYVADQGNRRIRKIDLATEEVTTFAGSGTFGAFDGVGTAAHFGSPVGVAVTGGFLYVADQTNELIRTVNLTTAQVGTEAGSLINPGFADGVGAAAQFNAPVGIVAAGGFLYVADGGNDRIRKIDLTTTEVTTLAGSTSGYTDGVGAAAQFNEPVGVAVAGGVLYVSDSINHRIRRIDLASGNVTTTAGSTSGYTDGVGAAAHFWVPWGVAADGDTLYVTDLGNVRIRKVVLSLAFAIGPSSVDFGQVALGTMKDSTVTISNTGDADLDITNLALVNGNAGFSIVLPTAPVSPQADSMVTVRFSPGTTGATNDTLVITHNAGGSPSKVPLTGTGTAPVVVIDLPSVDFGQVAVGAMKDSTVTISNTGDADLNITNLALADGNAGFSIVLPTAPVSPGADSTVTIRYSPGTTGAVSDTLVITHNAGSPSKVPLTGTGIIPIRLVLGADFGAPGDTLRIDATLTNPATNPPVGGILFAALLDDPSAAHFISLEDTAGNAGFTVATNTVNDSTRILLYSISGALFQPGTYHLATLVYVLDPTAALGSANHITPADLEIGDSLAVALLDSAVNGKLQAGIRGDVNLDARVSILDAIQLVRIILGRDPAPADSSTAFHIADANGIDGINVADVIAQVNIILGITPGPTKVIAGAPVTVSLGAVQVTPDGRSVIPVYLSDPGSIAGAQGVLQFDPSVVEIGTPQLAAPRDGLNVDSFVKDGTLRFVVYDTRAAGRIAQPDGPMLLIPVTDVTGEQVSLTLSGVHLANRSAQSIPVTAGNMSVSLSSKVDIPQSFGLRNASPNPFNPATTIAYDVPQQAHIRLTVYNLLGQEVVRLVDTAQSPGRYQAVWNSTNAQGRTVASGVYVYRLTSSTGFTQAHRMTLLK